MSLSSSAYATVDDLEKRFRKLDDTEREIAETLLDDAAVRIRLEAKKYGVSLEPDTDTLIALKIVSCAMVKRVLCSPGFVEALGADVREFRTDVGQLAETYGFANPDGSMKFTLEERKLLGFTKRGRISTIPLPTLCKEC